MQMQPSLHSRGACFLQLASLSIPSEGKKSNEMLYLPSITVLIALPYKEIFGRKLIRASSYLQVGEDQNRLIGSEQAILFSDFVKSMKAGDTVEGVIGRCTDFGAFVKLGAGKNFRGVQVCYQQILDQSNCFTESQNPSKQ